MLGTCWLPYSAAERASDDLQGQLDQEQPRADDLQLQLDRARQKAAVAERASDDLWRQLWARESQLNRAQQRAASAERTSDDLRKQLGRAHDGAAAADHLFDDLRGQLNRALEGFAAAGRTARGIQEALDIERDRADDLQAQLEGMQQRAATAEQASDDLRGQLGLAQQRAAAAEQVSRKLQEQLDHMQERVAVAEQMSLDTQEQLDRLQGRQIDELSFAALRELRCQIMGALEGVADEMAVWQWHSRRSIAQSTPMGVWQWQTLRGEFEDFEARALIQIEEHLARHPGVTADPVQITNCGKPIRIDFTAVEQQVLDGSGGRRKIHCADDVMLREPSWTHQAGPTDLVDVLPGTSDYVRVLNLMFITDGLGRTHTPVKIQRIQNEFLLRKFDAERRSMIVQRGAESMNERMLFHGTGGTDPRTIAELKEGFALDYANSGFYGQGLYYAVTSSNEGNMRHYHMLLCRVLCGRSRQMGTSMDREMTRTALPIETYDSIMAGPHSSPSGSSTMYVIYQEAQVYPDFLVAYRPKLPTDEPVLVPREAV